MYDRLNVSMFSTETMCTLSDLGLESMFSAAQYSTSVWKLFLLVGSGPLQIELLGCSLCDPDSRKTEN